jgi:predicted transcriptional regulator YdeE
MKRIVGIKIRVNNKKAGEIWKLWEKFFVEWHLEKLWLKWKPTYGVYFNYSSDKNGDFDLLVGWESDNIEWYETVEIIDSLYKEYTTTWSIPQKIHDAWARIWNDTTIQRAYKTDYEYYTSSENPKNPDVRIFIGVK